MVLLSSSNSFLETKFVHMFVRTPTKKRFPAMLPTHKNSVAIPEVTPTINIKNTMLPTQQQIFAILASSDAVTSTKGKKEKAVANNLFINLSKTRNNAVQSKGEDEGGREGTARSTKGSVGTRVNGCR